MIVEYSTRDLPLLKWIWADTLDDYGQIWSLAKKAKQELGLVSWVEVKREVLRILSPLVMNGILKAGFPNRDGFVPLAEEPAEQIRLISVAWDQLLREPGIGEVAWFSVTDVGRQELRRLVGE